MNLPHVTPIIWMYLDRYLIAGLEEHEAIVVGILVAFIRSSILVTCIDHMRCCQEEVIAIKMLLYS